MRSSPAHLARFTTAFISHRSGHEGDPDVLRLLNEQLTMSHRYRHFLHPRCRTPGLHELAAHTRAESSDEMQHAEEISTDRILLLDGLMPNYQRIGSLRIGQTLREHEADLAIEYDVESSQARNQSCTGRNMDTTSAVLAGENRCRRGRTHRSFGNGMLMDKPGEEPFTGAVRFGPPT